jgi:hypothetical protein
VPAQKVRKDLEEEDTDVGVDAGDSGMDHRHIYIDLEEEDRALDAHIFGIMMIMMIMIMDTEIIGGHQ